MSDDEVEPVGNATAPLPGVEEIKRLLGLRPLPVEGGYYAESYRSPESLPSDYLPARYEGPRSFGTAIYYLLTPDTCSELHRLQTDEVFHFYLGDPVEMLQLSEDGSGRRLHLGQDILQGMVVQALVPRGVWQGTRLLPGGRFALLGTTMAPGFDLADYESGERMTLQRLYPPHAELIGLLTR